MTMRSEGKEEIEIRLNSISDSRFAICERLGYTTCLSLYGFK
ncbi:MAG: hypothetical protein ACP5HK_01175 [Acidilobus sp.]